MTATPTQDASARRGSVSLTTHVLGAAQDLVVDHYQVARPLASALVLPGFGRTADEYFHLSAMLLRHGVSVVAPDFRLHPGRSAGTIMDFTLMAQAEDVRTLLDTFEVDAVLATSLSFPPSLRVLADRGWAGQLVGIVPVISPGDTLLVVTGYDWRDCVRDDYPRDLVLDIDGFEVNVELVANAVRTRMHVASTTLADAMRFTGTLAMVVGDSDSWVGNDQIRMIADAVPGTEVVSLPEVGHDFGRSVRRARAMFHAAIDVFLRGRGLGGALPDSPLDTVIHARQELRETGSTRRLEIPA